VMLVVDTAVIANPAGAFGAWWSTLSVSAVVVLSAVGQLDRAGALTAAVAVGATAQDKMARTTGVRRRRLMKLSFREGSRRLPYPRPIGRSRRAL
jgi:hypothetical protein